MNPQRQKDVSVLSDTELRIAVHKARGLLVLPLHQNMSRIRVGGPTPGTKLWELPDYCNDLNAMHEAEKTLTDDQYTKFEDYVWELITRDNGWQDVPTAGGSSIKLPAKRVRMTSPTARQRAEAFVKAMEGQSNQEV